MPMTIMRGMYASCDTAFRRCSLTRPIRQRQEPRHKNMARNERRRRVFNEEVLTAGSLPSDSMVLIPGDTPRYGAGANIENHPQVTDLVPRRYRVVAMLAMLAIGIGGLAEVAARYAQPWSEMVPVVSAAEITNTLANRTVAWTSVTMLLLFAGYSRLLFSLRRHRVDDYRGRYRVWRTASWVAVGLGFATITGIHTVVGRILGHVTGWNVLPGSPGWWLVPAILLGGWLMVKLASDAAECRVALTAYVLAIGCFALTAICVAGFTPTWAAAWPDTLGRVLPLAGNTFLLVGSLLFARYVVLDVQGLIEHAASAQLPQPAETKTVETQTIAEVEKPLSTISADSDDAWIDGTEPEATERRLSKSERKRLRKQQNRNRAA